MQKYHIEIILYRGIKKLNQFVSPYTNAHFFGPVDVFLGGETYRLDSDGWSTIKPMWNKISEASQRKKCNQWLATSYNKENFNVTKPKA